MILFHFIFVKNRFLHIVVINLQNVLSDFVVADRHVESRNLMCGSVCF